MNDDTKRELQKIQEAVNLALEYHTKTNEANAALHSSSTVFYSPLTTKLMSAAKALDKLVTNE